MSDPRGDPGLPGEDSAGGEGGRGGEGGKGGEGKDGNPGGIGGRGGTGGRGGQSVSHSIPVVVTDVLPTVNYKNTLRYIAVMMTLIVIILICEGISRWM